MVSCHLGRGVKAWGAYCLKICTVLARCLVFYLHMRVNMLFGVFMLKRTFRYIVLVNALFRKTVGQTSKILPVSRSDLEPSSPATNHHLAWPPLTLPQPPIITNFPRILSTLISTPCYNAARVIKPYTSVSTDGLKNTASQRDMVQDVD